MTLFMLYIIAALLSGEVQLLSPDTYTSVVTLELFFLLDTDTHYVLYSIASISAMCACLMIDRSKS